MRKIALLFTLVVIAMLVVNVDLMAQDAVAAPSTGFQMLKEKFIEEAGNGWCQYFLY